MPNYREPTVHPVHQLGYTGSQQFLCHITVRGRNKLPFSTVWIYELRGEHIFREHIPEPPDCTLNIYVVLFGDLNLWVIITPLDPLCSS